MAPPARAEAIPPAIAPNIITSLKWLETNNLFNNLIQRNQSAAFSSGKVRPNHETNINIIARRTGKDVNSHTVLDGIITTIMATIQRINIIGSREGSRNRRRLKANQTGKKFRVGIKSNISTNRNNLISGVDRCIHLNAMKKTTITSINRQTIKIRSEERFSRNAETDLVCRHLLQRNNNILDTSFVFLMKLPPPRSTLFHKTTLFRSRRLKANQTGKKFRVGIKSNINTNRNNLISGVDRCIHLNAMKKTTITSINRQTIKIGRAVQQECRDRSRMPSSA